MKKIFHGVSIFASLTLTSCGGASLSWPMPEATQVDSLRIFRQGDAMPREILAGVYPGDVARLELQGAPVGSTTLWTSSNPTMGEISTAGELRILSAGEFEILAQVASFTQRLRVRVSSERLDIEPELAEPTPNAVPQPSPEASPIPTRSPSPSPSPSPLPSPSPIASPSPQPSPAPDNSPPPAVASDPFIDELITFTPGAHAGFGANHLPDIVLGAPRGNGNASGGFHVLSLGVGGQVILKSATPILNEPGPDFIVFENAFFAGGNSQAPFAEPATVAVSQDGIHFVAFDCDPKNSEELYPGCAGVHPVYANSETNDIDPTNPTQAGGDAFDLETVGLSWIQWIRLQDLSTSGGGTSAGFDLDAIAILHQ